MNPSDSGPPGSNDPNAGEARNKKLTSSRISEESYVDRKKCLLYHTMLGLNRSLDKALLS